MNLIYSLSCSPVCPVRLSDGPAAGTENTIKIHSFDKNLQIIVIYSPIFNKILCVQQWEDICD